MLGAEIELPVLPGMFSVSFLMLERRPRYLLFSSLLFVAGLLWLDPAVAQEDDDFWGVEEEAAESLKLEPTKKVLVQGRRLYERRCIFCHGAKGTGDGPISRGVFPRPRDFTRGIFKIRSTPSGFPPTDDDLYETMERGLPGTMMPSFSNLDPDQLWSLVFYIKSFYGDADAPSPETIPIPVDLRPSPTMESISRGRQLFLEIGCSQCHGTWGNADGPSSQSLTDEWGFPIAVANLNQSKLLRGGHTARELYRSIAAGIGGTPMASFNGAISPEDTWHVVNYLRSRMDD